MTKRLSRSPLRSSGLLALAAAVSLLALSPTAGLAQETAPPAPTLELGALEAAAAAHTAPADRVRGDLDELLGAEAVERAAEARGLDLDRVKERAATLDDAAVLALAPLVSESAEAVAQSRTITISVYTIIIFLLILILIT
jgi:hypothetical protein